MFLNLDFITEIHWAKLATYLLRSLIQALSSSSFTQHKLAKEDYKNYPELSRFEITNKQIIQYSAYYGNVYIIFILLWSTSSSPQRSFFLDDSIANYLEGILCQCCTLIGGTKLEAQLTAISGFVPRYMSAILLLYWVVVLLVEVVSIFVGLYGFTVCSWLLIR